MSPIFYCNHGNPIDSCQEIPCKIPACPEHGDDCPLYCMDRIRSLLCEHNWHKDTCLKCNGNLDDCEALFNDLEVVLDDDIIDDCETLFMDLEVFDDYDYYWGWRLEFPEDPVVGSQTGEKPDHACCCCMICGQPYTTTETDDNASPPSESEGR